MSPRLSPWRMLELLERDELKATARALDIAGRPSVAKPKLMVRIAGGCRPSPYGARSVPRSVAERSPMHRRPLQRAVALPGVGGKDADRRTNCACGGFRSGHGLSFPSAQWTARFRVCQAMALAFGSPLRNALA